MRLTQKLLGYLHRVFDKSPKPVLALRLRYAGTGMQWAVSDGVLTTTVTGGPGAALTVNLADYTVRTLVSHLAAQPGYSIEYAGAAEVLDLSARALIDAEGDQDASNGDHLYAYTSLLWAYLEPFAAELKEIAYQIDQALAQMNMRQAEAEWLDEWGGYYGIPRRVGEVDADYANRIIIEVLRPRGNNIAIEMVAKEILGQGVTVKDVRLWGAAFPKYDSVISHNGAELYDAALQPIYGLFDVEYVYNLESGADISEYALKVASVVNSLRDAGTHLRAVNLMSSQLNDTVDTGTWSDGASLEVTYGVPYDGRVTYDGLATYSGISVVSENLS